MTAFRQRRSIDFRSFTLRTEKLPWGGCLATPVSPVRVVPPHTPAAPHRRTGRDTLFNVPAGPVAASLNWAWRNVLNRANGPSGVARKPGLPQGVPGRAVLKFRGGAN